LVSDAFVEAVEAIYKAAGQPSTWPDALAATAAVFGDIGANLLWMRDDRSFGTVVSAGLAPMAQKYDEWQHADIRAQRAVAHSLTAQSDVLTDRHLVTQDEIDTHPFYTQFLAPGGFGWLAAARVSPDPRMDVWIGVQRLKVKPIYSDEELDTLGRLARHAEQSLRLSVKLFDAEHTKLGLADALTRVGVGIFALDTRARVVFSNPAAERLLNDGLFLSNSQLSSRAPQEHQALRARIKQALRGVAEVVGQAPKPLLIHRGNGKRPLALYFLPIGVGGPDCPSAQFLTTTRAVTLVIEPQVDSPADPSLIRDLLGLTLGEARVAALIGIGLPPRAAAKKLGISENTVRCVLRTIFSKTGVSRQSELATLLGKSMLR
jgi:DNA-binding CsgD family transcriptional regulator/PAS domain-containing protein